MSVVISRTEVDELETLIGQLFSLHGEMTGLTKKSSSDAVNAFKLKLINKTLARCNARLGDEYRPFDDFAGFDRAASNLKCNTHQRKVCT